MHNLIATYLVTGILNKKSRDVYQPKVDTGVMCIKIDHTKMGNQCIKKFLTTINFDQIVADNNKAKNTSVFHTHIPHISIDLKSIWHVKSAGIQAV